MQTGYMELATVEFIYLFFLKPYSTCKTMEILTMIHIVVLITILFIINGMIFLFPVHHFQN
jgi:hypothetical protein